MSTSTRRPRGITTLVSRGNGFSRNPSISGDGRYIAFESAASNLVPGDRNEKLDVFVYDRVTSRTSRVSVSSEGVEGNNPSNNPAISADGRYVAFTSYASNLVPGDTKPILGGDVFVHDGKTGKTVRASVSSEGKEANGESDYAGIAVTAGGEVLVVFRSGASNLVPEKNAAGGIFLHSLKTGRTELVSVTARGRPLNALIPEAKISADGRFVAFVSLLRIPGEALLYSAPFVRDLLHGTTTAIEALAVSGGEGMSVGGLSAGGEHLAVSSGGRPRVPAPDFTESAGQSDIFVTGLRAGPNGMVVGDTTWVSKAFDGEGANEDSGLPVISGDGRYIAFESRATNLVRGDTNGLTDVFLYDGFRNTRVSVPTGGNPCGGLSLDKDGDGLPTRWECGPVRYREGTLDLRALGADPLHKDIFVECDYMKGPGDDLQPGQAALDAVAAAFARAPLENPEGATGITLHIDAGSRAVNMPPSQRRGNAIPFEADWSVPWGNPLGTRSEFAWVKSVSFDPVRQRAFHYCIFANDFEGNSEGGAADEPGDDLLIALGDPEWGPYPRPGLVQEQARTLMHELGHNLGLKQGGDDDVDYKPNYLSVMNSAFLSTGLIYQGRSGYLDYSRFSAGNLDELALVEKDGVTGPAAIHDYGTYWACPNGRTAVDDNVGDGVDWDCDGSVAGVVAVNTNSRYDERRTWLFSFDDWRNLVYAAGEIGRSGARSRGRTCPC